MRRAKRSSTGEFSEGGEKEDEIDCCNKFKFLAYCYTSKSLDTNEKP